MIVNLKYHIASLAAVFLALGLGILVGTTMLGDKPFIDETNKMILDIRGDLVQLEKRNEESLEVIDKYEKSNELQQEFQQKVSLPLIKQKLVGSSLSVINTTGNEEDYKGMISSLIKAGAKIESTVTINENFNLQDNDELFEILKFLNININVKEEDKIRVALTNVIAKSLVTPEGIATLKYLNDKELIHTSGRFGVPLKGVVVVGGNSEDTDKYFEQIDKNLIKSLVKDKIQVFGVESSTVAYSYMKHYQRLGVTTIDNVDKIPGQIALVYAIFGQRGNYGEKSTADKYLPEFK
jgi:hypothetical protein